MIILREQLRRILDSQLCDTAITQVSGSRFIWITAMTARISPAAAQVRSSSTVLPGASAIEATTQSLP